MAGSPAYWDRVLPGFSSWEQTSAQNQQTIEKALAHNGNTDDIKQKHTKSVDPCDMQRFTFVDAERGANDIKELEGKANNKQALNKTGYDSATTSIDSNVQEWQALELPVFATKLRSLQEDKRNAINKDSKLLEEIVSQDAAKRKGRDEVLKDVYGASVVQGAQAEAKAKMYKQIRTDRISQRMRTTMDAAETMYEDAEWMPKLKEAQRIRQQLLNTAQSADELHQQADAAMSTKHEIQAITDDLERKQQAGEQQLVACKQEKVQTNRKLDKKRDDLVAALKQVKVADAEYTDAHIENELLRLQVSSLENNIADIKTRKAAAQDASQLAVEACEQWREKALDHESVLRDNIAGKAMECQTNLMQPARAVTSNIMLAKKLLANVTQDNDERMSFIGNDIEAKVIQQKNLQAEMDSEEPERDIDDVQSELAMAKDEQESLQEFLDKAKEVKCQLDTKMGMAQSKFDAVLQFYVDESVDEGDREKADGLADDLYKNLKLWLKGKQRPSMTTASSGSVPSANQGALVTIDPNMQAFIIKMIEEKAEEKAQQKFEQLRADQLFRHALSTGTPSEISEFDVIQQQ